MIDTTDGADPAKSLHTYEALASRLRREILAGEHKPGDMLGSEYGLARSEQISRMTVRRASELLINEGLVERRPGKGLFVREAGRTVRTVQFVAGNLLWEPWLRVARGAQTQGKSANIQVQLHDAHGDLNLDFLRDLPDSGVAGAIVIGMHSVPFNEALYSLKLRHFPLVLVDQHLSEIGVPSVTTDNLDGGRQLGALLTGLEHRRIAFIGDLEATTVKDRLEGLRDALADAGLPIDRSLIKDLAVDHAHLKDWSDRVEACTREVLSRPHAPTALFCSCDAFARAAYRVLDQMGLRVPTDISVVGFDDDPLAEWLTPALTTIRQPFAEIGREAMTMLCACMQNPDAPTERRVLPANLVHRASVAAPRSGG